jgi:hypothetical protein
MLADGMTVDEIEKLYPNSLEDPHAELFLTREVNKKLMSQVRSSKFCFQNIHKFKIEKSNAACQSNIALRKRVIFCSLNCTEFSLTSAESRIAARTG